MIQFNKKPGDRILELGCGDRPHEQSDVRVDVRQTPCVHFVCDLEEPLPVTSGEFAGVYCAYALEHVSWRKVPQLVAEAFRVLAPGGRALFLVPDTRAQMRWILDHPSGWDGHDFRTSASCVLFGDCDYPENSHKAFFDPQIVHDLFTQAGFVEVHTQSWGERGTDLLIDALKAPGTTQEATGASQTAQEPVKVQNASEAIVTRQEVDAWFPGPLEAVSAEVLYDKDYWNGGAKVGGYVGEGYWDYPVHEVTARHILARKPQSVLELGAARGYVLKRIHDAGVPGDGLEVSKHCRMTAVCKNVWHSDLVGPWHFPGDPVDLCYSVAVLEHIPPSKVGHVITQMAKHAKRGLHGIDFGAHDDGNDKTHFCLRPRDWWLEQFALFAPGWPVEILDKEELERGEIPSEVLHGDGRLKLNLGCSRVMFHRGWLNVDVNDHSQWAAHHGYRFRLHDLSKGLSPWNTGAVDAICMSHVLEHFDYQKGVELLRECRRVLDPHSGVLRIAVPDASLLARAYAGDPIEYALEDYDEINYDCAAAPTPAAKFWALLHHGHSAAYDLPTLTRALDSADLKVARTGFRNSALNAEVLDMFGCLSLYVDAVTK